MEVDNIKSKLTSIFRTTFANDAIEINEGMTAADVPQWDSLSHLNLVLAVEKGFCIRLKTSEIRSLASVGDLIQLIQQKAA